MKIQALGFIMVAGLISLSASADDLWLTNFEQAKKAATEQKRQILVNFSGSDWCGWCKKLDSEVFATPEFKEYAKSTLVLFQADFPRNTKQAPEIQKQNEALSQTYSVEGFPTVLLLSADGKLLARTGYQRGGGKAYVDHVKKLLKK